MVPIQGANLNTELNDIDLMNSVEDIDKIEMTLKQHADTEMTLKHESETSPDSLSSSLCTALSETATNSHHDGSPRLPEIILLKYLRLHK